MECLLDHPDGLSQAELAAELKCSKTSVFRITMTLVEYGYLLRSEETKNLTLSRKLLAMGAKALSDRDLIGSAIDVLRTIRDQVKETVLIGTVAASEFVVLEQVLGSHPFKFSLDVGTSLPLHTSAPAKALLAYLPLPEREALIARTEFTRFNDATIVSADAYRRELDDARQRGYALDRGEQLAGIHCVAAPVFNRHGYPVAAVWTTGPAERLKASGLASIGEYLAAQVSVISGRLGFGLLSTAPPAVSQTARLRPAAGL